jgi:hypothetical protein
MLINISDVTEKILNIKGKAIPVQALRVPGSCVYRIYIIYIYIYDISLTAIRLTPGGSSTAHIYTQTVNSIQRKGHT